MIKIAAIVVCMAATTPALCQTAVWTGQPPHSSTGHNTWTDMYISTDASSAGTTIATIPSGPAGTIGTIAQCSRDAVMQQAQQFEYANRFLLLQAWGMK